ncbi:MAG: ZIP family metal transporter, partial [Nitrososphaerota archaeon]|nr:ZIP family metal transporter [Nitrososphaerota archaeon]
LNSSISLIGILFLPLNRAVISKILMTLVAFASGALLGGAFLHLIPEGYEIGGEMGFAYVLSSILIFFILEKFLRWRHCHDIECKIHAFAYLNLIGDSIHNCIDGVIIATSFLVSVELGIITAIAVIIHEVPQEVGDFGVLLYGGFDKMRALLYNFVAQVSSILGAISTYYLASYIEYLLPPLVSLAAGGFIYIGATDLFPELHKRVNVKDSIHQFMALLLGVIIMWSLKIIFE